MSTKLTMTFVSHSTSNYQKMNAQSNEMTIFLPEVLSVPKSAQNVRVSLIEATVVNNFDNIIATVNDRLHFTAPAASADYITFEAGMYSIDDINSTINRELQNKALDKDGIKFSVEYSTNILYVSIANGWTVDFTQSRTLGSVVGFTQVHTNSTAPVKSFASPPEATNSFGLFRSLAVKTNLSKSMFNGQRSNILDVFSVDAKVGFTSTYRPFTLNLTDGSDLKNDVSVIIISLENTKGDKPVVNDPWTVKIQISYDL